MYSILYRHAGQRGRGNLKKQEKNFGMRCAFAQLFLPKFFSLCTGFR